MRCWLCKEIGCIIHSFVLLKKKKKEKKKKNKQKSELQKKKNMVGVNQKLVD